MHAAVSLAGAYSLYFVWLLLVQNNVTKCQSQLVHVNPLCVWFFGRQTRKTLTSLVSNWARWQANIKLKICSTKWLLNMIPNQLRHPCNNGQHMQHTYTQFFFWRDLNNDMQYYFIWYIEFVLFLFFQKCFFVWKFIVFNQVRVLYACVV